MGDVEGRIPGFVVPLKTTEDIRILEFFLVPYYGACIHVPPPPPNQIIHVKYKEGFTLEALYRSFTQPRHKSQFRVLLIIRTKQDDGRRVDDASNQACCCWIFSQVNFNPIKM